MAYSLTISRADGGPLQLIAPTAGYELVGKLDPGEQGTDLVEVEGTYQHGSAVLGYRLRRGSLRMQVRVRGSSASQVESRAVALVSAVRQISYTVTYTKSGATHSWRCHPASITIVRGMDAVDAESSSAVYALTIPRQPIPLQGAI